MSVKTKIKALLATEDLQLKELAEALSEKNKISINPNNISRKINRETIKYNEVEEILDVMGYDIVFVKR